MVDIYNPKSHLNNFCSGYLMVIDPIKSPLNPSNVHRSFANARLRALTSATSARGSVLVAVHWNLQLVMIQIQY
jgi:hypothetical protein